MPQQKYEAFYAVKEQVFQDGRWVKLEKAVENYKFEASDDDEARTEAIKYSAQLGENSPAGTSIVFSKLVRQRKKSQLELRLKL
ncbi:MAG: hypothetical protein AABX65_02790 [Nanoarchaeota archaeon]